MASETEKPGRLTSSLKIELHCLYAIRLWEGRPGSSDDVNGKKYIKHHIMSMPQAIKRSGVIYYDSTKDNPYADEAMYKIEALLTVAGERIQSSLAELDAILKAVPPAVSFSEIASSAPLNIGIYSQSPLGYRCVWILVGYDQMALKAFQAAQYGLISRKKRDELLSRGAHLIRKVYGVLLPYRTLSITREDLNLRTAAGTKAIETFGLPDADILSGKKRSSFSPPLRKENDRKSAENK